MVYYIYFQDSSLIRYFTKENVITTNIMFSSYEIDEKTCRKSFYDVARNERSFIYETAKECSFILYIKNAPKRHISAVACVTVYGNMWESTLICGANRGNGGMLLDKLKAIAGYYDLPITLYGMGTKRGSRQLYERNGFHLESDSYRFVIHSSDVRKSSSPRRSSSTRRIHRHLTGIKSSDHRRSRSRRTSLKKFRTL